MSSQAFSWILIAEITLPFFIICCVLGWILFSQHKKNKRAARQLIAKIKSNEAEENKKLLSFLTDKLSIESEQAKKATKKIINERKFLFRNLISGLLDKNVEVIAELENDMSRITNHYHQLDVMAQQVEEVVENESAEGDSTQEIKSLKKEIKSLKHEVHITLTTLNNIFGEFSSMFGEAVPNNEMSVDEIINAMEAFSTKSASSAAVVASEVTDAEASETIEEISEEVTDAAADMVEEISTEADLTDEEAQAKAFAEMMESESEDTAKEESLDFSIDEELDDIDSALDELELDEESAEPSWDEAFEESGDKKD